jgi:hypothetical protein
MNFKKFFLKLSLNIFPPLFFNRILLKYISSDYREINVILKKSIFNINYYKSIYGGSIFSACDPYFPIMYYQIFKNRKLIVWVKSAEINYIKPAYSSLKLNFKIQDSQIKEIEQALFKNGKHEIINEVKAINLENVICAEAKITVYLRDPNFSAI